VMTKSRSEFFLLVEAVCERERIEQEKENQTRFFFFLSNREMIVLILCT
jgi:hypothetical protein